MWFGLSNLIPQRYVLGVLGFFATFNSYAFMVVINIAITEMVETKPNTNIDSNECSNNSLNSTLTTQLTAAKQLYNWDQTTKGIILSSFFVGYVLTQLPGGIVAEKFGGKQTLFFGLLISSLLTLITPSLTKLSHGDWRVMTALRIGIGSVQGPSHPSINALLSKWVPLSERAKIGTLVFSGSIIGTIVTNVVSGILIKVTNNWASPFYFFGTIGVLWCILWQFLCYSEPNTHPFISEKEKDYLKIKIENRSNKCQPTPWKAIFTSAPIWAMVAAQTGHDWGFITLLTDLPSYMSEVLKFNVLDNGIWNSIPYLVMWICSIISGWLCDWLITKGHMTIQFARKFFTVVSSVGPSIFTMAASYSGCNKYLTVGMFTIAMAFKAPFYCGFKVNALDLAPNYSAIVIAVVNGIGSVAGGVAPYIAGALTSNHTLEEWRSVFWMTFAVYVITSIIFCIWGEADVQEWNDPEQMKNKEKMKETTSATTNSIEIL